MRRMTIPAINLIARLSVLFVIGLASSIADAQTATRVLEDFLAENRCSSNINENKKCLTAVTNKACSSGCMRRGYNWTEDATNPTLRSRLDLHMTTPYLKLLRNAVIEAPWYTLRNGLSFGYTLEQLLYHQVQMFLIDDSTRYHSATMAPLSQAAVKSGSHTVDPTRFWMVAFGNDVGAAQSRGESGIGWEVLLPGVRHHQRLRGPWFWRVLSEREVRPGFVIIREERLQMPAQ